MELGKEEAICQLEQASIDFPARDGDDTTARLVAVSVKGHVQEMESLGLDDGVDDSSEEGQRICTFLYLIAIGY